MMTWEEKEDVNEFVVTSVLSAFTLPKFIDIGKQIHCLAVKNGLFSVVSVGNVVVTLYAKCGSLDNALQMFELSSEKNSITWSAMIIGYTQSGDGEKALKMFSDMHFSGMRPSEFTLVGVLNARSDVGATVEGKQLHGYLRSFGAKPEAPEVLAGQQILRDFKVESHERIQVRFTEIPNLHLWLVAMSASAGCTASVMTSGLPLPLFTNKKRYIISPYRAGSSRIVFNKG
ncbi:unnamed protein product [Ilex paraguariensis]|uniref:Pentatricopeptide repeat-containing protein n=1 Tax=Ilex paraguariensis TaxID=185542 RepID=A0ABC8T8D5_9AQUA